jgi:hypothetical protein
MPNNFLNRPEPASQQKKKLFRKREAETGRFALQSTLISKSLFVLDKAVDHRIEERIRFFYMGSLNQSFRQRTLFAVLSLNLYPQVSMKPVLGLTLLLLSGCAQIKNATTYDGDDSVSKNQRRVEQMNEQIFLGPWSAGGRGF